MSCPTLGGGNGNPLQYSCLENPMGSGVCWAAIQGVAKSWMIEWLLQRIFLTQESNPGVLHCRQILLPTELWGKPLRTVAGIYYAPQSVQLSSPENLKLGVRRLPWWSSSHDRLFHCSRHGLAIPVGELSSGMLQGPARIKTNNGELF